MKNYLVYVSYGGMAFVMGAFYSRVDALNKAKQQFEWRNSAGYSRRKMRGCDVYVLQVVERLETPRKKKAAPAVEAAR